MAYWWVFQGDSFLRSRSNGYLWAPKIGMAHQKQTYWTNMTKVRPGDIIFSGFNQKLVAISTAISGAEDAAPPDPKDKGKWPEDGWKVAVSFEDVDPTIPYKDFVPSLLPTMQDKHAAFNVTTEHGNLGYLYFLPTVAGEMLVQMLNGIHPDLVIKSVEKALESGGAPPTSRKAVIDARIGQGDFRKGLEEYWGSKCAVGECRRRELLRASHMKPWSACNDLERLDKFNGLLLGVGYDAAFDSKLISFDDKGNILVAKDVRKADLIAAGINPDAHLRSIESKHLIYLHEHQELFHRRQNGDSPTVLQG